MDEQDARHDQTPPSLPGPPASGSALDPIRQRYKLTIAYDGSAFHGWQKQEPPGGKPFRTVQGEVERVAREVFKQPVTLVGASRTDAGVHANGQVAQVDAATRIPVERIALALNARLPLDIEVRHVEVASPTFDAIRDPVSKQYRYRVWNVSRRPLGIRRLVYHFWTPLDIGQMNDAAARLVGEHDFAGFAAADHGRQSTVRTIHRCFVERPVSNEEEVHIVVEGSGFLYNMVRIIAGTLLEVGRGHWPPHRINEILAAKDRRMAGPTAPPEGLCLEWIRY